MLAAEKSTDLYTPENEPLLVRHVSSVLTSSTDIIKEILSISESNLASAASTEGSVDAVTQWSMLAASVRVVVESTFVGSLLPMLCTFVTSMLLPLHDVPSDLIDLHEHLREENNIKNGHSTQKKTSKWSVNVQHASWLRETLELATQALSYFDQMERLWNRVYRSYRIHLLTEQEVNDHNQHHGDIDSHYESSSIKTPSRSSSPLASPNICLNSFSTPISPPISPNSPNSQNSQNSPTASASSAASAASATSASNYTPHIDVPYEILHVEPKIHFIRRQLSSLVGTLSGALLRLTPNLNMIKEVGN